MKHLVHQTLLRMGCLATALAVCVGAPLSASAQDTDAEMQTMVVVSVNKTSELMADFGYLTELAGQAGIKQMVEGMIMFATGGRIDADKPFGLAVRTDGAQFVPLLFVPARDVKGLLETLGPQFDLEVEALDDGVLEVVSPAGPPIYIKEKDGYAYASNELDALENLPADPVELLGDLPEQYDTAVRLNVQAIPEMYRELAVETIRSAAVEGIEPLDDESDEDFEARQKMMLTQIEQIEQLVNETDQITLGWLLDREAETAHFDMTISGVAGSELASKFELLEEATSNFAGFLRSDAAVTINLTTVAGTEKDIANAETMIQAMKKQVMLGIEEDADLPDDAAREILKSAVGDLMDVLVDTMKEGRMDGGMSVLLAPDALTIAAGAQVADGNRVEKALRKIAELAEDEPKFTGVNWDAEEHGGVTFHTLSAPLPEDDDETRALFGDQVDIAVGIADKAVYFAFGKNSVATLKTAIDASKAASSVKQPPMQMNFSIGQFLAFAAAQEPDDADLQAAAEAFAEVAGKDHIVVTATGIANGERIRISFESGLLQAAAKAVGAAIKKAQGGAQDF